MKKFAVKVNRHPRRRNNVQVNVMYEVYLAGRSLAEIATMYHRTRQAVYDVFRSRGYELRSKKLKGLTVIDCIRFTETKGGYLRGTLPDGRRLLAHQYVWEKTNGLIPADAVLHFKDGNPKNVSIGNLELVPKNLMTVRFNPEKKGCFGRPEAYRRMSVRERVKAERDAAWKRAMAIG